MDTYVYKKVAKFNIKHEIRSIKVVKVFTHMSITTSNATSLTTITISVY